MSKPIESEIVATGHDYRLGKDFTIFRQYSIDIEGFTVHGFKSEEDAFTYLMKTLRELKDEEDQ